ncbi:hypothetical protein ACFOYW_17855 [Gryllotalpicola reticulitermitis]|uniref:DUF7847 domain-containing protein n=1 Tax=Gryllotalpicola reticulitermitis TaxID=1184153 RepID=A0ABV8QC41_9MICO
MSDPTAWDSPRYGAPPGWAPPPRPGLIPLRPLTFGQLLGTPFQLMRRHVASLFGPALLIQVLVLFASLALVGSTTAWFAYRLAHAETSDRSAILAGGIATVALSALIAVALNVIGSGLLQGLVVIAVANGTLGHKPRAGQLWQATRGRRWALAGFVSIVTGGLLIALLIPAGIAAAVIAPGASTGGSGAMIVVGVALAVLAGLGVAVLVAWLWAKSSLAGAAIVLERRGIRSAIARSWSLSRGAFWRVFGAQILVIGICYVATQIISTPVTLIAEFALQAAFPTGTPTAAQFQTTAAAVAGVLYVVLMILTLIIGTVTAIIEAGTGVVVYIDQRMRREGLDLTLTRYVEDAQLGRPLADPFATPAFLSPQFAAPYPPAPGGAPDQR